jgi:hypothetical protein
MVNFVRVPKAEKTIELPASLTLLVGRLKEHARDVVVADGPPSWEDLGKQAAAHPCKHLALAAALRSHADSLEHENRMLRERLEDLAALVIEKGL